MFNQHHRLQAQAEEAGEGASTSEAEPTEENAQTPEGEGALDQILSPNASEDTSSLMTVEDFIAGFDADEKESVAKYAHKFANENGNIDVQKVMKSGFHLDMKFGGFTGAPNDYSIPTPEGLSGEVDLTDPYLVEFMASAKELNMSQAGFEQLMDIHLRASIAPSVDVELLAKEIGPDFDSMRENMAGFFKSRLSNEEFQVMNNMITGSEALELSITFINQAVRPSLTIICAKISTRPS